MSRTPARPGIPPPALGQDAHSVLCDELAIADDDYNTLVADGVIGKPD